MCEPEELADIYEEEFGYPKWPEEMQDPDYFRREFAKMRTDPRYNKNLGRSMDDPEFWNEAARAPWAKVLLRKEQHWTDRRNVWLQQYNTVVRNNRRREELGELLEDCPGEVKRLVAPMLKYKVVEALLFSVSDEARELGTSFRELVAREETLQELRSARRRLDAGGEAEARRLQENLDDMMQRATQAIAEEKKRDEHARGRVLIDMHGLKMALDFGQKCKKDGLIVWQRGNAEEALGSWRQADETLRRFRAPARCINENNMIIELHSAILRNVAQAAIRLERWNEALDAADRAIELQQDDHKAWFRRACALEGLGDLEGARKCLAEVENAAVGRPDRDRIVHDCGQKRERLQAQQERHAADQQRMLQRGLSSGVFSSDRGRLASSAGAGAGAEAEAAGRGRVEGAAPTGDRPKRPQHAQLAEKKDRKRLTLDGASDLLDDLEAAYTDPNFVRRVDKLIQDVRFDSRAFMSNLGAVAFDVQTPLLQKWGFEPSAEGLAEMRAAMRDFTRGAGADARMQTRAETVNRALYGSPSLRMYERVNLGA